MIGYQVFANTRIMDFFEQGLKLMKLILNK
jgi:hypothetical protein